MGRRIQRGELPRDTAELPAAIDIATRQRRALNAQQRRRVRRLTAAAALLWLVSAVVQIFAHDYGYACFRLPVAGTFLVNPLTMRRQRRRLETVEQALHIHQHPQGTSDTPEAPPVGREGERRPESPAAGHVEPCGRRCGSLLGTAGPDKPEHAPVPFWAQHS